MADYCLYPNHCGLGAERLCNECHQAEIARLTKRLEIAERVMEAGIASGQIMSPKFHADYKYNNLVRSLSEALEQMRGDHEG